MQLQFDRKPFRCLQYMGLDTRNFEESLELRLPETGGIHVICAKGQPLIRSKEWRGNRVGVSGGVTVCVLYTLQEDDGVKYCEGWLPFQQSWDIPNAEADGTLVVSCLLSGLDARLTGADKVMVTASVSLTAETLVQHTAKLAAERELPGDIHLLRQNYPVCICVEAGEKPVSLDEELRLAEGKPEAESILFVSLQPGALEQKLMADKLVYRGTVDAHVLYTGADGKVNHASFSLPLSQYVQLEKEYGVDGQGLVCIAVTDLDASVTEGGKVHLKGGLLGQYMVFDRPVLSLVEDAYSNKRMVAPQFEPLELTQMLEQKTVSEAVDSSVPAQVGNVVFCEALAGHPSVQKRGGGYEISTQGVTSVLYYDEQERLQCASVPWDVKRTEEAGENIRTWAKAKGCTVDHRVSENSVAVKCELPLWEVSYTDSGMQAVVGLDLEEVSAAAERKPALILCRAGGEPLWQLAKANGSSVEAIMAANGLVDASAPEKILLIPVE